MAPIPPYALNSEARSHSGGSVDTQGARSTQPLRPHLARASQTTAWMASIRSPKKSIESVGMSIRIRRAAGFRPCRRCLRHPGRAPRPACRTVRERHERAKCSRRRRRRSAPWARARGSAAAWSWDPRAPRSDDTVAGEDEFVHRASRGRLYARAGSSPGRLRPRSARRPRVAAEGAVLGRFGWATEFGVSRRGSR